MARAPLVFAASLLSAALLFASCDSPESLGACPERCVCTLEGCPADACGFLVTLDESCADMEPRVEIFVAGCLEEQELRVAEPTLVCAYVLAGSSGAIVARGERVQWGPVDYECPEGGGLLLPVSLSCPTEGD